jgi:hypothetical protein
MKKLIAATILTLMALNSTAYAVDWNVRADPVTTYEDGRPLDRTPTYVWFQGTTDGDLRQVGETPAPTFARTNVAPGQVCFAVQVRISVPTGTTPTNTVLGGQSPVRCETGNNPLTMRPATPRIITLEVRPPAQ